MAAKFDFSSKVVWVTGARRGIGYSICQEFVNSGAIVHGLDIEFDAGHYPFETHTADVSKADQVAALAQKLLEQHGRIDALISAAGVLRLGTTDQVTLDDLQYCFNVNTAGPFNLFHTTLPVFREQRHGAIVVVSSNSAHAPRIGMSAYGPSKAALRTLCQTVGLELAPYGVRCNIVSPGSTDTPMQRCLWTDSDGEAKTIAGFPDQYKLGIPLQKIAQPGDIASIVLFLASDAANHVVLQDIVADGGATLGA